MPRPKSASSAGLTAGQSQYVLSRLIKSRRVSTSDVNQYLGEMQGEIAQLEDRLRSLRGDGEESAPAPARRSAPAAAASQDAEPAAEGGKRKRRKQTLTPARRAALRNQGHYLALIRQIPKTRRASYKSMFKSKGAEATIKALRSALNK